MRLLPFICSEADGRQRLLVLNYGKEESIFNRAAVQAVFILLNSVDQRYPGNVHLHIGRYYDDRKRSGRSRNCRLKSFAAYIFCVCGNRNFIWRWRKRLIFGIEGKGRGAEGQRVFYSLCLPGNSGKSFVYVALYRVF